MSARTIDLLLLHPPSVYDFREKSILYGPVSDMVPSSVMFELYPIGFLTMAGYLKERGLEVRIVNIALRMLTDARFDVEKFLAGLKPKAIGIDLHWMPHCHGAIEIARLAKKVHPDVPVLFGGLSSTYFHDELLRDYPEIDFVLRGDSTEPPLHTLLGMLENGGDFHQVPNLTWRKNGEVRVNPLTFVPKSLDYIDVHPELLVEMAIRHRDVTGVLPFNGWLRNPITMVLPLKGCAFECVTCGSSASTCVKMTMRRKPVFRSPSNLVSNLVAIGRMSRGAIVIPGDLLQGGKKYAKQVIDEIEAAGVDNEICFEFFDVPPIDFLRYVDARVRNWSFEVSPESHDKKVRHAMEGQAGYENEEMENMLREALKLNCNRIDVFYMIGLPFQTYESVMETIDYCESLFKWGDKRLQCFISPMGPFLDPGSQIFEDPEKFGFRKFAHTVEEHRQLLTQPSWEHILNYESDWMTREQLVDATYDSAERLNALKLKYGRITAKQAKVVADGIAEARRLRARLKASLDGGLPDEDVARLRGEISRFSQNTVCDKQELFWHRHVLSFNLSAIAKVAMKALRN
ncbi:TIGR04190 family B12-binding domain/radical SAM domain protein [Wenzhouxiangella sp. XN24]|uniref:TIGR04190 family B12-binding domain/radical SAM domain protein n=1 Tax=Wenzhouxiangella sp. XN24 TaxID=2713569 RepID=UPI0013E9F412|nr:TIGR04190 family B12-binding domain/radical SAM domain protein [Wenzhouxiangella sp. XN24]NGX17411.1 TIGR04190 family B12-binding domain/radical SAM domain protein [Wenzhouxiangella sp. XN24]